MEETFLGTREAIMALRVGTMGTPRASMRSHQSHGAAVPSAPMPHILSLPILAVPAGSDTLARDELPHRKEEKESGTHLTFCLAQGP